MITSDTIERGIRYALRDILKESRRERLAVQILAGMHANPHHYPSSNLTNEALVAADRLIAALDAPKPKV